MIALIGIVLLIGIVKKNAIMMIDFALEAERVQGKPPREAIYQACLLRFRPIMMTTMAALLAGVPLAFGSGTGSELRRPLGITIIGGLIFSQALTLFTTPVIYLWFERLAQKVLETRMNISEPFIRRPIATTLLTVAIALAGGVAFRLLPVSPLPEVDFPTVSVSASLPGASAETMASAVATPLERQFGHIAAVTEMTSSSTSGIDLDHTAIRFEPQYRRGRARRAGGHRRGARATCRPIFPAIPRTAKSIRRIRPS